MSKSILLIDRDRNDCESLQELLEFAGHTVEFATDEMQANTQLQGKSPDLILLDLHMNGRSGSEQLINIRSNTHFYWSKVLVLTTDKLIPMKEMLLADGVLIKPFKFDALLAAIQYVDDSVGLAYSLDAPMSSGFDN